MRCESALCNSNGHKKYNATQRGQINKLTWVYEGALGIANGWLSNQGSSGDQHIFLFIRAGLSYSSDA